MLMLQSLVLTVISTVPLRQLPLLSTLLLLQQPEFTAHHEACLDGALELFDGMATMGRKAAVRECREQLCEELAAEFERFEQVCTYTLITKHRHTLYCIQRLAEVAIVMLVVARYRSRGNIEITLARSGLVAVTRLLSIVVLVYERK
jgi:hypothetical protein